MIDGPVSRNDNAGGTLWDSPATGSDGLFHNRPRDIAIPGKRGHAPMAQTSLDARAAAEARGLKPQQLRILRYLAQAPATSDDIVSVTGLPPNVVAPRLQELRAAGWVERLETKRKTRSGTSAFVHAATASGIAELRKVGG